MRKEATSEASGAGKHNKNNKQSKPAGEDIVQGLESMGLDEVLAGDGRWEQPEEETIGFAIQPDTIPIKS